MLPLFLRGSLPDTHHHHHHQLQQLEENKHADLTLTISYFFIHSLHSFFHSRIILFTYSLMHIHSPHSFGYIFIHALVPSHVYSLVLSFFHTFTHVFTFLYSLLYISYLNHYSLTHSMCFHPLLCISSYMHLERT